MLCFTTRARVAELVDAADSKSAGLRPLRVRVSSWAFQLGELGELS